MIDVTESTMQDGSHWWEIWSNLGGRHHILAEGRSLDYALVVAERVMRRELDDLQSRLYAARAEQKVGKSVSY